MDVHPRMFKVNKAEAELSLLLLDFQHEQGLTDIEFLQMLHRNSLSTLKYMLRSERHPDDRDKGADEL